jgi:cellobiose phosphorylase
VDLYKVEPYAVCADVYGAEPHTGRGGWTWYTGAAGWIYRIAVEAILGVQRRGDTLRFEPCVPAGWPGFTVTYRYGATRYRVRVDRAGGTGRGVREVTVDGQAVARQGIRLVDDGRDHEVWVALG